jgi:two-component system chemotaxis sensor kinase CheA
VDNLVETIGELVIVEAMVSSSSGGETSQRTRHQLAQMSKIVRDLQRQGLALRMVPLRGVFQKMSRLVRDLSRRSAKPVHLELSGQDAEMDRSLAERLGDPLVHMMRNAVDHGVEPVAVRRAAGKPDQATLRLRAFHEGGNILIELSDDGKGLDRDAILAKAVAKGLVSPTATLTDRDVYDLIFAPGFSTAEKVTELSGRGVGMDVVKRTVEDLRGRIQISTQLGKGTTFRLVLPLTLAIIDGMLLTVGGRRYVLPTLSILESLRPRSEDLHRFAGGPLVLDVRGAQLPQSRRWSRRWTRSGPRRPTRPRSSRTSTRSRSRRTCSPSTPRSKRRAPGRPAAASRWWPRRSATSPSAARRPRSAPRSSSSTASRSPWPARACRCASRTTSARSCRRWTR